MNKGDSDRVLGFDIARAFAILGMVVVHFSLVMGTGRDSSPWFNCLLGLLDGRATATFVILAGIGVTLMSRRAVSRGDPPAIAAVRRTLIRRGMLLLGIGFLNLYIWPGDILRVYGVALMLASMLIAASSRQLLLCAMAFEVVFVLLFLSVNFESHWDWGTMTYHGLWTPAGVFRNLFYDGFRSVFPWTGFLLFGMWLGRLNLLEPKTNRRVLRAAWATAASAEMLSWLCTSCLPPTAMGLDAASIKALFGTESMPALPLFVAASGGAEVAVIILSITLASSVPAWICWPLCATGQMALTWYVVHIVFGLGAIEALDLVSSQPLSIAVACGVGFFLIAIALSCAWKYFFRHGPLEWCLRRICDAR
ncbi:MAG: Membrane protein [Schlesneria sp.]|nr:Membrane protein [Schlesneria sp.]